MLARLQARGSRIARRVYKCGVESSEKKVARSCMLIGYAFKDSNLITRQIRMLQDFVRERIAEQVTDEVLKSV